MVRSRPAGARRLAAVLFTDVVGSTSLAARLGDDAWRRLLERHHKVVRRELRRFSGRELDTAGDGFFASFDTPDAAVRCACAIMNGVADLGLELRAGVHMGEAVEVDRKVGGMAVHIGARIAALAGAGEVLVSSTVRDLMPGSGVGFDGASRETLKGVDEPWTIYRVRREDDLAPRPVAEIALPEPKDRRGRRSIVVAVAAASVAGVVALLLLVRPGAPAETPPSPSPSRPVYAQGLFRIDPDTNEIVAVQDEDLRAGIALPIVRAGSFLWVSVNLAPQMDIRKLNPENNRFVGAPIPLEEKQAATQPDIAVGDGSVWVMHYPGLQRGNGILYEIDPNTNAVAGRVPLARVTFGLAVVDGEYWVVAADGEVLRIDPRTGAILDAVRVGGHPVALVGGEGWLWVLDSDGEIERVDPRSFTRQAIRVAEPLALAVGDGALWVTTASGSLVRFDAQSLERTDSVPVGMRAFAVSVGAGSVWVGTRGSVDGEGEVLRVDAATLEVEHSIPLGGRSDFISITAEDDAVWLGTGSFRG